MTPPPATGTRPVEVMSPLDSAFLRLEGGQELKLSRTYRDKVEYFLKRPRAH